MMEQEVSMGVPGLARKKELLHIINDVYSCWIDRFPLACRKGCADCCTRSVSMSSLEGLVIDDFIKESNRGEWLRARLASAVAAKGRPALTMNQFALACLNQQAAADDPGPDWDFTPCMFLENSCCTIYGVRPFGCRIFGSLVRCAETGTAEMAPIHLAVNTVFTQMIEHLCCGWGYWGNMADILKNPPESKYGREAGNYVPAQPIPGFLLASHEKKVVLGLLLQLQEYPAAREAFGDLIDNFLPME